MGLKAKLFDLRFRELLGVTEEITQDQREVKIIKSDDLSPSEAAWIKDAQLGRDLNRGAVFRSLPKKTPNSKKRREHIRELEPNMRGIKDPKIIKQEKIQNLMRKILESQQ